MFMSSSIPLPPHPFQSIKYPVIFNGIDQALPVGDKREWHYCMQMPWPYGSCCGQTRCGLNACLFLTVYCFTTSHPIHRNWGTPLLSELKFQEACGSRGVGASGCCGPTVPGRGSGTPSSPACSTGFPQNQMMSNHLKRKIQHGSSSLTQRTGVYEN